MPLQKSFSEQDSRGPKRYQGRQQWNRSKSLSTGPQYPRPPPPPPPPPVEISKNTKSKLKTFQYRSPRVAGLEDDQGSRRQNWPAEATIDLTDEPAENAPVATFMAAPPTTAREENLAAGPIHTIRSARTSGKLVSQKSQASKKAGWVRQQEEIPYVDPEATQDVREATDAADEATEPDTAETSGADKENNPPSTQPNKATPPISATPEFLSIHVDTPRARFAWQDLAGTPDTPKVRESLGLSPNAQISWMPENTRIPSPVQPRQGAKRARSSSPPSSPTNSKSKLVLNVQKFREALKTAPPPPPRNRLTRHRTAVDRTATAVQRSDSEPQTADKSHTPRSSHGSGGPSPRNDPTLRRAVSCGLPLPKRQRVGDRDVETPSRRHRAEVPELTPKQHSQHGSRQPAEDVTPDRPAVPLPNTAREAPVPRPPSPQLQENGDDLAHDLPVAEPEQPHSHRGEVVDENMPDTEFMSRPGGHDEVQQAAGPVPEVRQIEVSSDYGDDDDIFDEDMLAQIDASLAPDPNPDPVAVKTLAAIQHTEPPAEAPRTDIHQHPQVYPTENASNSNSKTDEFDDLDDDIFSAAEDLIAELDAIHPPSNTTGVAIQTNRPVEAASTTKSGGGGDDMEDMYGDDFGADFDYDAAEKAATQAAGTAAPWANTLNSSQKPSQKARAIQRYLVTNVIASSYIDERQRECPEKASHPILLHIQANPTNIATPRQVLVVQAERTSSLLAVHLRGDWIETSASIKSFVHVLGEFDSSGTCIVDNDHNMLILHPDQLVSSTVVADSFSCTRRAVLQDRVKATSDPTSALVYGTLLHEIFQDALMANQWTRSYLSGAVDKAVQKHLEELYTIRVETNEAREHLLSKTKELQHWAELFITTQPKPDAVVQGRNGEKVKACVSKLLDVEEHVWSPMYGLKGNIDATVQITMESGQDRKTLTVPFELKTGRNASANHQAQTVLYNLLLSDRYDLEIVYGILYYTENSQMLRIPTIRHELRHMIMQRNALACYIRERSVQLPPMKRSKNVCGRCYAQASCFIYHKLADDGDGETSGMGDKFDEVVKHLTPKHKEFFLKWEDLLTKEEKESQKLRRELWTMVSAEREKLGRCFGNVIIEEGSAFEDKNTPKINRFHYTFIKETPAAGFSFMDSQLAVGEPIVVSDEQGHFALALGYVTTVRKQRIEVAVDRRLHNARIRQRGFDEKNNQVFAGIMEATPARSQKIIEFPTQTDLPTVRYRLDKDEFSNGMAVVRNNLVQVMAGAQVGSHETRNLVVDLVPPRFKSVSTQYMIEDSSESLNVDQKRAIEKVMSAQDYALVLGMPGTGKTTTIAHIIRALVRKGKSVLLTSYTHTAVDNILLKLRTSNMPILRLGAPAKVHPEVREFATLAGEPQPTFEAIRQAWHDTPVVATTCLGISHPVFNERTFDYCIVDEASQITLPICLGPIRMARTFVLVGDHNQLPPLVQNEEARAGGLDVSLFKLLSDTHPDSVVNLEHQYRMCEDIMTLSNTLIYNGRLKCGTEALRFHSLDVPDMAALQRHHHTASSTARLTPRSICPGEGVPDSRCWLQDLLRPETRVAFVNTDTLPGSREEAKGNRIVNPSEARVVSQLVESLITVGVPASEIGVMTHYRSQLSLLKHQLRGITASHTIEMHTADRFQGRDKEVVVLSLVRSNEACSIGDLLKDWRRINVAFTRAKTKLLVIGSRSTLKGNKDSSAGGGNNNHAAGTFTNAIGFGGDITSTGEEMLARFIRLMEERSWIYDLPADALENHLFDDIPSTQAVSGMGAAASPDRRQRAAMAQRDANQGAGTEGPRSPSRKTSQTRGTQSTVGGKENRQPLKRVRIGEGALLKGKPILQGILNDMMGGKF